MKNKKNIIIWVICGILICIDIFVLSLKPTKKDFNNATQEVKNDSPLEPLVPVSEQVNLITDNFKITGYMSFNGKTTYFVKNSKKKQLNIEASKFNLPNFLKDYEDDILLEVTYREDNEEEIYNVNILNGNDNTKIVNYSKENFASLFTIDYNKNVNTLDFVDNINLRDLKEDEVYLYKVISPVNDTLKINNNLDYNVLVYTRSTKDGNTDKWQKKIISNYNFKSNAFNISYNSFNIGDTYEVLYQRIDNATILNMLATDKVIHLSNYNDGDKIAGNFAEFIYNDTNSDITITTSNNSVTIPKDTIYGYDWMISNAYIKIN